MSVNNPNNTVAQYIITAKSSNTETLYYRETSNGDQMTPYAYSIAEKFQNRKSAAAKLNKLKEEYAGLSNWEIELVDFA